MCLIPIIITIAIIISFFNRFPVCGVLRGKQHEMRSEMCWIYQLEARHKIRRTINGMDRTSTTDPGWWGNSCVSVLVNCSTELLIGTVRQIINVRNCCDD